MVPNPTPIFHITPIDNLRLILETGELRAKRALEQEDAGYTNIAHRTIQDRRSHTKVTCGLGGVLHDYVPFYFAPRSPMLYTISHGNVEGFTGGQQSIVHLVSTAQAVREAGLGYVFTNGHAIMVMTDFYDDLADLTQVDWPLMKTPYWFDTVQDPDRKRRRQAEFLIHKRFPVMLIQLIGVMSPLLKQQVEKQVADAGLAIPVAVKRQWYY